MVKKKKILKKNCTLWSLLYCCILIAMRKFMFLNLPCLNVVPVRTGNGVI